MQKEQQLQILAHCSVLSRYLRSTRTVAGISQFCPTIMRYRKYDHLWRKICLPFVTAVWSVVCAGPRLSGETSRAKRSSSFEYRLIARHWADTGDLPAQWQKFDNFVQNYEILANMAACDGPFPCPLGMGVIQNDKCSKVNPKWAASLNIGSLLSTELIPEIYPHSDQNLTISSKIRRYLQLWLPVAANFLTIWVGFVC